MTISTPIESNAGDNTMAMNFEDLIARLKKLSISIPKRAASTDKTMALKIDDLTAQFQNLRISTPIESKATDNTMTLETETLAAQFEKLSISTPSESPSINKTVPVRQTLLMATQGLTKQSKDLSISTTSKATISTLPTKDSQKSDNITKVESASARAQTTQTSSKGIKELTSQFRNLSISTASNAAVSTKSIMDYQKCEEVTKVKCTSANAQTIPTGTKDFEELVELFEKL
ncbi:hypothetical protein L207DRAFT_529867 [Hyaloscypha variabilis F]|jgi:hypothetical protein|uniref:Uncharacterized protein n=1 Tax=Hyaloscypha variabilis (strain UAMH 11265 / GT02V1 / F) TaxID=1149755 RepID=A0A2J6RN67_HYAVF|nr:hypothetical protein L207DRAFT_529867 [Hyaloscypha variabilis F]